MEPARKPVAEFIGTFWLVLIGCGSAVLATGNLDVGIGWLGVAFAFGLALTTIAYVTGGIRAATSIPR
jgi:aquaporin Z